ncbi:pup--protein ligase [bacterium BMS3Abin02]|nr:pup--protein ligase [bacterium BMS3Abin02]GBE21959.1 pup--protein ligase [bacterium BMS3Bbin01]HDH26026.1 Pup--protein ligase [Actinomycetota bacterium]HDL48709.1 Pup--protein ligase [Actinomycetota bacterium]
MKRRIYGLESEYGVTCTLRGQRRLSPDEAARYLFRRVVSWGRSSNVFLENGARLYLDVGSHPEYATPECDDLSALIATDKAGERILQNLAVEAQNRLGEEGISGEIFLFKNNTDSAGNSYGCHENYLIRRSTDFPTVLGALLPFLVTRQIFAGAGKLLRTTRGVRFTMSQRAEHIWEGVSSATTRSRPIVNTRDEPHADAALYRRLHVIAGDSNMSEIAGYAKVGVVGALLQMLEEGHEFRALDLENPIRAIREISSDPTCRRRVRLANGRELSALDIQWEYLDKATQYARAHGFPPVIDRAVRMWEGMLAGIEKDPMTLASQVDWVAKWQLIEAYRARHDLALSDPRLAMMDLSYHDINPARGLYNLLVRRGKIERVVDDAAIAQAMTKAPATTRARLRGEFIRAAKAAGRDFTVDWVHLKVNDQAQRTVLCKDPFVHTDPRVDRLIAGL